jgi:phosphatidylserine/phosphatidylglycerophosphate/cardiolipin synthase-like enzyme
MAIIKYGPDPLDEGFRSNIIKLLGSAKKEVVVVTGEASSFGYYDLRKAAKRARERGVNIRVYATKPELSFVNAALNSGFEVYIGDEEQKIHYSVYDGRSVMVSEERPEGRIGARKGSVFVDDPKKAREVLDRFDRLVSKSEKVTKSALKDDSLYQLIQNPPDWGIALDATADF